MRASTTMSLIPKRPPPKRAPSPTIAYRPPDEQYDWIAGLLKSGWSQAQVLGEVVGLYMHLDKAVSAHLQQITDFARAEGFLTDATPEHDRTWVREAMVALMLRGLEHGTEKKGGKR